MFQIIVHFFMQDKLTVRDDNPATVLASLNMRSVSHVEIISLR